MLCKGDEKECFSWKLELSTEIWGTDLILSAFSHNEMRGDLQLLKCSQTERKKEIQKSNTDRKTYSNLFPFFQLPMVMRNK